jgi:Polysaccharide pyruvyl transferase
MAAPRKYKVGFPVGRSALRSTDAARSREYRQAGTARRKMRIKLARHPGRRAVLLFGAYGNGNLGDRALAGALASGLARFEHLAIYAYSELTLAPYELPDGATVLTRDDLPLNPRVLRLFDALVIGPGGLLAHPHVPLWSPTWPSQVPIPYGLVAVGVATPLPAPTVNLVRRAHYASARDERSRASLDTARSGTVLCPDPILAELPTGARPKRRTIERLFVLRGPVRPEHHVLAKTLSPKDEVVGLEIGQDWPLSFLFPRMRFEQDIGRLATLVGRSRMVLSERYHGAVIAITQGIPVVGVIRGDHNSDKLIELFAQVGRPNDVRRDFAVVRPPDCSADPAFLAAARADYERELARMVRDLVPPA